LRQNNKAKSMKKFTLLLFFTSLFYYNGQATHVFGGDITWTQVGKDSFLVKATYYRDCNGIMGGNITLNAKCKSTYQTIASKTINMPNGVLI